MPLLPQWTSIRRPVIGMLHAPPLPGSPGWREDWPGVRDFVLRDAEALVAGGVDGLMLENFGDVPFFPGPVPAETVAHLTALAVAVRRRFDVPLGINALRNDGQSALAVAMAAEAQFVRVNVLCGARITDQGLINGIAHELLRDRARLGAADIRILADVDVKHSAPLAARPLAEEVNDLVARSLADGIIVSGSGTGQPADAAQVLAVKQAAGPVPVLVGSGISLETVSQFGAADGFIVGSSLKEGDSVNAPVDRERVRRLIEHVAALG